MLGQGEIDPKDGKENAKHRTGQAAGTDRCTAGKGSKGKGKQPAGKTGEIIESATAQSTWKGPAAAADSPAGKRFNYGTVKGDEMSTLHNDDARLALEDGARWALEGGAGAAVTHSPSIKPEKRFACEEEAPATCQGDGPAAKRLKA